MGDHTPSGDYFVYPTRGNAAGQGIGASAYKGSYHSEKQLARLLAGLQYANFVQSGFTVPASSGTLVLAVAAGVAIIDGRVATVPGSTNVTCTANQTNYIFLKLERDAEDYVVSAAFEVNTTGTAPDDSVLLASAVAGASSISSTTDRRPLGSNRGKENRMLVVVGSSTPGASAVTGSFTPTFTGKIEALLVGGGGGGGGGTGPYSIGTGYSGGGGGSGAALRISIPCTKGTSLSYSVPSAALNNLDAGDCTLGAFQANGGDRGNNVGGSGGAGGAAYAGSGDYFALAGQAGGDGSSGVGVEVPGGGGGAPPDLKFLGVGGIGRYYSGPPLGNYAGNPGIGYGAGGAGGPAYQTLDPYGVDAGKGGAGTPGLMIIFW